jgi:hypothetical protein
VAGCRVSDSLPDGHRFPPASLMRWRGSGWRRNPAPSEDLGTLATDGCFRRSGPDLPLAQRWARMTPTLARMQFGML